jgi:1-acyl-sn-glycerol-3-phosphate acyltransferase
MSLSKALIVTFFRGLTSLICRIDDAQLARVPERGPLILVTNHINILEIPIIYTRLMPRRAHGLVLADRWKNPLLRWILSTTENIPLVRGEANPDGFRRALAVLKAGEMLIVMPEGTRSRTGQLQIAHTGVVLLALRSGALLLPIGFHGAEKYKDNLSRLRRTNFYLEVGKPFTLRRPEAGLDRQTRQQMADEIMYQVAAILPPEYRGVYANLSMGTQNYLNFN